MNPLHEPVLVLTKAWDAYKVIKAEDALMKLYSGDAFAIETHFGSFSLVNYNEWVDLSDQHFKENPDKFEWIRVVTRHLAIPHVLVEGAESVSRKSRRRRRWDKKVMFMRDLYCCQYCGRTLSNGNATVDHVFPQARGGKNTYENTVTACFPCNSSKDCRTPEEAGMRLAKIPVAPRSNISTADFSGRIKFKDGWKTFATPADFGEEHAH